MKYRIKITKHVEGYEYNIFQIKGDVEEYVGGQSWYSMFKWMSMLKAKLRIRRIERIRNYPIEVANVEYETKNQAT